MALYNDYLSAEDDKELSVEESLRVSTQLMASTSFDVLSIVLRTVFQVVVTPHKLSERFRYLLSVWTILN